MATTSNPIAPRLPVLLGPIGWVGHGVIGIIAYMGELASLLISCAVEVVRPSRSELQPGFWPVMVHELSWMLTSGFLLVGLVHVGLGSFLSMQAYFGSTFLDGTGAVVGVGLLRNLATLMTGMTLSGLLAARMIPELRDPARLAARHHDVPVHQVRPDRGRGVLEDSVSHPLVSRIAAPRIAAAMVATPLLSLWGFVIGTVVGWQASGTLMGLSSEMFFIMMVRMIWFRDVVGLLFKGCLFGACSAAICCFEGLRDREPEVTEPRPMAPPAERDGAASIETLALRAACLSMMAILLGNMAWFVLVYHAVPVYGPSLLAPPGP